MGQKRRVLVPRRASSLFPREIADPAEFQDYVLVPRRASSLFPPKIEIWVEDIDDKS